MAFKLEYIAGSRLPFFDCYELLKAPLLNMMTKAIFKPELLRTKSDSNKAHNQTSN